VLILSINVFYFCREHIKEIKKGNPRLSRHDVDRIHNERFQIWFRNHVTLNKLNYHHICITIAIIKNNNFNYTFKW